MSLRRCNSCGAAIRWAMSGAGKRMPLDYQAVGPVSEAEPAEQSYVLMRDEFECGLRAQDKLDRSPVVWAVQYIEQIHGDRSRYRSHFATCPDAQSHRRRR